MSKFEDLEVFQTALDLRVEIHRVTADFPKHELFGIVAQLRRAAGSVVRNIAEGHGRLTFGEWRQFLSQGRGSLFEVEAELIAAHRLGYIDGAALHELRERVNDVGGKLMGLIRYVLRRERESRRLRNASRNPQPATPDAR